MKDNEIISVIIPVYNVEKHIHRCLDSVLNQTYKNLEIILVDDGSSDSSPEICDEYVLNDDRILVIHKSNGGLSSARNVGLDIASGSYVAFIDSDDYIHTNMLGDLYFALIKNKAELSVCNLQYVDENGNTILKYPNNIIKDSVLDKQTIFMESLGRYGYYYTIVCNKLYKRNLWENYRFPEGKYHEDDFSFHHIIMQCNKIACIRNIYYFYVQHDGSIMALPNTDKRLDALEASLDRLSFFKENQMSRCLAGQDQNCFWCVQKAYQLSFSKENQIRYHELKHKYYEMHKWVIKNISYPRYRRVQAAVFYIFPFSKIIYDVINNVMKFGKSGGER